MQVKWVADAIAGIRSYGAWSAGHFAIYSEALTRYFRHQAGTCVSEASTSEMNCRFDIRNLLLWEIASWSFSIFCRGPYWIVFGTRGAFMSLQLSNSIGRKYTLQLSAQMLFWKRSILSGCLPKMGSPNFDVREKKSLTAGQSIGTPTGWR